jgi:hypothetical protein
MQIHALEFDGRTGTEQFSFYSDNDCGGNSTKMFDLAVKFGYTLQDPTYAGDEKRTMAIKYHNISCTAMDDTLISTLNNPLHPNNCICDGSIVWRKEMQHNIAMHSCNTDNCAAFSAQLPETKNVSLNYLLHSVQTTPCHLQFPDSNIRDFKPCRYVDTCDAVFAPPADTEPELGIHILVFLAGIVVSLIICCCIVLCFDRLGKRAQLEQGVPPPSEEDQQLAVPTKGAFNLYPIGMQIVSSQQHLTNTNPSHTI